MRKEEGHETAVPLPAPYTAVAFINGPLHHKAQILVCLFDDIGRIFSHQCTVAYYIKPQKSKQVIPSRQESSPVPCLLTQGSSTKSLFSWS